MALPVVLTKIRCLLTPVLNGVIVFAFLVPRYYSDRGCRAVKVKDHVKLGIGMHDHLRGCLLLPVK